MTPESNRSKNASRAASAAGNYSEVPSPSLEGSTSSLRPPSRRPRRSSSTDGGSLGGQHQDGPRRGLFVRPNQVSMIIFPRVDVKSKANFIFSESDRLCSLKYYNLRFSVRFSDQFLFF